MDVLISAKADLHAKSFQGRELGDLALVHRTSDGHASQRASIWPKSCLNTVAATPRSARSVDVHKLQRTFRYIGDRLGDTSKAGQVIAEQSSLQLMDPGLGQSCRGNLSLMTNSSTGGNF